MILKTEVKFHPNVIKLRRLCVSIEKALLVVKNKGGLFFLIKNMYFSFVLVDILAG